MHLLTKLLDLLSPAERLRGYLVLVMIVFMAMFDVIGVASIAPFIAALTNPEIVLENPILLKIHTFFGFSSADLDSYKPGGFLFFLGILVFTILLFSISFKALTTYIYEKFSAMRNYTLSRQLVRGYLSQPYSWFLHRHSADLGKTILSEVNAVIAGTLLPMMKFISHLGVVIAMIVLLVIVDSSIAITAGLGLGGVYLLIYLLLRKFLGHIGEDRVISNQERFKIIQEGFGGIKDIKIYGLEGTLLQRFDSPAKRFAMHTASQHIAGQLPRFALEAIAFGGMLLLLLVLMTRYETLEATLPMIALYTFAGYRLIPSMQQVYSQLTQIRFSGPALNLLHSDMMSLGDFSSVTFSEVKTESIGLKKHLKLEDVSYQYEGATTKAVKNVSLTIPARNLIGLVGATGSGKTTTADLMLGLLSPSLGKIIVDDHLISKNNITSWQSTIGYVPQQIYLIDDSVYANIGFGLNLETIDRTAAENAAKIANLHGFIVDELPEGYSTEIGERGVRLSGGQRQRIGIARALYYDPDVLVFDEATSSLDNLTERAVMDAIHNIGKRKTIILIAHRMSTVRKCDQIFIMEKGSLIGQGTYDELMANNALFKSMVSIND